MKFVIDREIWYRGREGGSRLLRAEDGMKCCIGFVGEQCGIPKTNLVGKFYAEPEQRKWPKWFFRTTPHSKMLYESNDLNDAYNINDATEITDKVRERKLRAIFKKHGDTIVFKG